jgi:hypothetical protein
MLTAAEHRMLARRHLDGWVIAATRGLADESHDRVREEIVDHFREALEAGVASGLGADAAARQAVESLGPAKKARREFRRTYLTTTQANLVRSFAALPRSPHSPETGWVSRLSRFGVAMVVTALTMSLLFVDWRAGELAPVGLLCLTAMVLGTLGLAAAPRIYRHGRQRAAVALGGVSEIAVWGGYLLASGVGSVIWLWALALFFVILVVTVLPVLPKLPRRAGTD